MGDSRMTADVEIDPFERRKGLESSEEGCPEHLDFFWMAEKQKVDEAGLPWTACRVQFSNRCHTQCVI